MSNTLFKKIEQTLYLPDKEARQQLSPRENERRKRWLFCISQRMDDPLIPDRVLVDQLIAGMPDVFAGVHRSTAYQDISAVGKITGNIQLSAKNWYRYMIIEGAKKAYEIAQANNDAKGMAAALDKIGKYTMADKPDNDFDWSQMIPLDIEPSADADLLENIEPIENVDRRREELRALFKSNLSKQATDAEFTEE